MRLVAAWPSTVASYRISRRPGLARQAVQPASRLVDDLGRGVHAIALCERQLLVRDRHRLSGRDLEDEVDGCPEFEVHLSGHDALHRSILACRDDRRRADVHRVARAGTARRVRTSGSAAHIAQFRACVRCSPIDDLPSSHARARPLPRTAAGTTRPVAPLDAPARGRGVGMALPPGRGAGRGRGVRRGRPPPLGRARTGGPRRRRRRRCGRSRHPYRPRL